MKKYLFYLIIPILCIFLIPKNVFASTSTTFQLNFYPLSGDSYSTLFTWLNDTSNTYIDTTIEDFEYYTIYTTTTNFSNYRQYDIYLYASNTLYYLDNEKPRGSTRGHFGIAPNSYINLRDHYIVYKENNTNNWYNSTNFNNTTLITSLDLSSLISTNSNIILNQRVDFWEITDISYNRPNNIYMNNVPLSNNQYNRDLLLYNNDTQEEIATLTNGDIYTGYRGIFYDKPAYLNGYKKITIPSGTQYIMLSGLTKGSVFVGTSDYSTYHGMLSYYDKDISPQPFDSNVSTYRWTSDLQYIQFDFDLSTYQGADLVMFSKYIYFEGIDNFSYDIYVPNDIYVSNMVVTPNSTGANDFSFDYKDSNGNIVSDSYSEYGDLNNTNPLLGTAFEDFASNTFGLTSIITAPLSLISQLTTTACVDLNLPIPFLDNKYITLPCMYSIYQTTLGDFFSIYQMITFGLISYWVLIRVFNMIKDFKNPDHDEVEVMDL